VPLEPAPPVRPVDIAQDGEIDEADERACPLDGFDLPFGPDESSEEERAARITVAEVVLRMLDWMGDHKCTWESADGAWAMLKTLLPVETKLCVFNRVKAVLVAHLNGRMRRIEVCPCGYTVYTDCHSAEFADNKYQNAHRTRCPRPQCGLSRCVPGVFPPVARKVCIIVFPGYNRHTPVTTVTHRL
jgi:hypothetical protein